MAVQNLSFEAQINEWCERTEDRLIEVFRESAQRVTNKMAELTPVDTGFLRSSIQAGLNAPANTASKPNPGGSHTYDGGEVSLVINNARLSDVIYCTFGANYAIFVEYGTSKMAPRAFVRQAAAQWPQIVNQVAQEAQARSVG